MARCRSIAAVAVALAAFVVVPAQAFDAGPHTDMTRDAFTAEGFGTKAADVAVVENWFVDYYWNADDNPFSGHGSLFRTLLSSAGLVDFLVKLVVEVEDWPDEVIAGTNHLHFDSAEPGFPDLGTTAGVDEEWQRLMKVTRGQLQQARDPLTVLSILGISLHGVQDFYAHSNWVETAGQQGSPDGPGWSTTFGSYPTYFDVPKAARDDMAKIVYSAVGDHRGHGDWNSNRNEDSLAGGMNKDWPGRALYQKAYLSAYFGTRQWIRAARGWLGNDALWRRAQQLAAPPKLQGDLNGSLGISEYAGHWQGSRRTLQEGRRRVRRPLRLGRQHLQPALRDQDLPRGRGLLEVAACASRQIAPAFYEYPQGDPVPEPLSTAALQRQTRFVKLEVTKMRGYDWALGDPGPDDADLYANARIRGQRFTSTVLHDHDRFSFPKPYGPFTWIRSVPVGQRASAPVEQLTRPRAHRRQALRGHRRRRLPARQRQPALRSRQEALRRLRARRRRHLRRRARMTSPARACRSRTSTTRRSRSPATVRAAAGTCAPSRSA